MEMINIFILFPGNGSLSHSEMFLQKQARPLLTGHNLRAA